MLNSCHTHKKFGSVQLSQVMGVEARNDKELHTDHLGFPATEELH